MDEIDILIKNTDPDIPQIKRFYSGDAGYDLFSGDEMHLKSETVALMNTKTIIALPNGHFGLLCLRSSLACKGIVMSNCIGIIDSGYRGEIKIPIRNLNKEVFYIKKYMRIAQLIILQYCRANFVKADKLELLDNRGTGGFGSSGA